ncbi:MAG: GntR family transcriptional regulator [Leucobacter sp.]|nr:GntR family transcriptional regulator [Leucobacter sp.]
MARQGAAKTLSSHVYELVSNDIMNGQWRPGARLAPAELSEHYGTSTTVVREVLVRLASEYLAVSKPSQGFFVPSLTLEELKDLTLVRVHNDTFALQLAIERGDINWETEVMTKHHVLARTMRRTHADPLHTRNEWSAAHREFHAALIVGSNVPMLLDLSRTLFDAGELYRRWAAPSPAALERDIEHEHDLIMQATLDRDTEAATALLASHYIQSLEVMLAAGFLDLETQQ